eukprot:15329295-Ditylum_brightwellii.AAC.1
MGGLLCLNRMKQWWQLVLLLNDYGTSMEISCDLIYFLGIDDVGQKLKLEAAAYFVKVYVLVDQDRCGSEQSTLNSQQPN